MYDTFLLSAIDIDAAWFAGKFEDYHLFGYVGDRGRLSQELRRKSFVRRLIEVFAPRVNIGALLNALAKYELLHVDPGKTLAQDIINLVTEQENQRKLNELLAATYRKGRKSRRYFDTVDRSKLKKVPLFSARFNDLQDCLITVEGQLLHRSAVPQFNPNAAAPLRRSTGEWLLADFPPHALVNSNKEFKGKFLLLVEDPGFSKTFGDYLPFSTDIAWYPYVRITGFFDASHLQTEIFPSLSISLVEYRRPRIFQEIRDPLVRFLHDELYGYRHFEGSIYFKEWSNLLLFAYLTPIVFRGSNLEPADADEELAELMRAYTSLCAQDLPSALTPFYKAFSTVGLNAPSDSTT